MADGYKLYKKCPTCKGVGTIETPFSGVGPLNTDTITCPECEGHKQILWGWCTVDTFTLPSIVE